jgi:hypothetical protein
VVALDERIGRLRFRTGAFLPLTISAIAQQCCTPPPNGLTAFAPSALAAASTSAFTGELNAEDLVTSLMIVLEPATVIYSEFLKPGGIAPAVEQAKR